jgi:hypothetical protein
MRTIKTPSYPPRFPSLRLRSRSLWWNQVSPDSFAVGIVKNHEMGSLKTMARERPDLEVGQRDQPHPHGRTDGLTSIRRR